MRDDGQRHEDPDVGAGLEAEADADAVHQAVQDERGRGEQAARARLDAMRVGRVLLLVGAVDRHGLLDDRSNTNPAAKPIIGAGTPSGLCRVISSDSGIRSNATTPSINPPASPRTRCRRSRTHRRRSPFGERHHERENGHEHGHPVSYQAGHV